ncbi:MAG: hypothetical protein U0794_03750 [Isosphaeraceae bacterium]
MTPNHAVRDTTSLTHRLADWSPILATTLALVLAITASGCGGAAVARPASPDAAQSALRATLDAWQRGEKHGEGGVRVADEDWLAGQTLVSYRLLEPGDSAVVGIHLHCPVELTLRGPRGKAVKRRVTYEVTTEPTPSVLRLDTP